jgi:hypothetical protein
VNHLIERIERMSVPEPNTGCWLLLGALGTHGYGTTTVSGRRVSVHRLSYEVHVGEIAPGKIVLHKCDTKSCVNPLHMTIGTHHDNAVDRTKRGRRDTTSSEQRNEWGVKGARRGSWGLGLNLKERLYRLSVSSESGCRVWQGTVTKSTGYGEIKISGRKTTAHRAMWIAHHGEIPVGLVVMHSCDNRLCINPEHLSVGTRRDNSRDMAKKGRGGFDRLSPDQRRACAKRAMQTLGVEGMSARAVARVASTTSEERHATANKGWKTRRVRTTPEQRHVKAIGVWTGKTPEERAAYGQKVKEGRLQSQEARRVARQPSLL